MKNNDHLSVWRSSNVILLLMLFAVNLTASAIKPMVVGAPSEDLIYTNGFEELGLGVDPGIVFQNAKMSFIANSYMGAWGGLNNYIELSVNASDNPVDLNTIPARMGAGGWFWGMGLSNMTPALDRIENEGDYDTCVFLDSASLPTMRSFADRLFAACNHVVLFADAGGHNPERVGGDHYAITANTLANARTMQSEYPELIVVPTALVFYDLITSPPVNVPRLGYLYGFDNIHQNGLGTLINAFSMYAIMTARSPEGLEFTFDQPASSADKFIDGNNIWLGYFEPDEIDGDFILFDQTTRVLFQQQILANLIEWKNAETVFDN